MMNTQGLRAKSSILFIAGILIVNGLTALFCIWAGGLYLERNFREESFLQTERVGGMLIAAAESPNDLSLIGGVLQQQMGGAVLWVDQDGRVLFGDENILGSGLVAAIRGEDRYFTFYSSPDEEAMAVSGIAMQEAQQEQGVVILVRSAEVLSGQQNILRWTVASLAAAVAALGVFLYALATDRVYRVIKKMTAGIYALTEEREPVWPEVVMEDETGQLLGAIRYYFAQSKNKQEKSLDNYQRLDTVIGHLNEGVILVNPMNRIMYINQKAGELLGYDSAGLFGEPVQEVFRDYDLISKIDQVSQDQDHTDFRVRTVLPSHKILKADLYPLDHTSEDEPAVLIILLDESDIEKLTQMRSEFVANVSHELRTPLTSIKGFAETIQDSGPEDGDKVKRFADIIESEADRLTRLIDDLLDLARIESGRIRLDFKRTNILRVIQETLEKLGPQLEKAEISLELDTDSVIHPFLADPDRISQVLINYVDNSMKYTHKGGTIGIRAHETESEIIVEVIDNGVGIPTQDLGRIFERFYRVDKARTRISGGTGLGLAIVKHIIEAHGGRVFVRSTPGEGSTFGFALPKGE